MVRRRLTMEAVIFICGCGHSGTTLMANVMAAHPDVYIPFRETAIFRTADREKAEAGYRELYAEAEASGKRYLVEKTPRHIRHLPLIRSIEPRARFVVPVRDGRDVAASYARRAGDPALGVNQWIKSNAIVNAQRKRPDVLIYRHEDLVDDFERTLRKICGFASIPFDDAMLRYHETERLWFGRDGVATSNGEEQGNADLRNWQVNQPIFDNRGRWQQELSSDDIADLMRDRGERLMRRFGYLTTP